jgi:xylulose-5-phosphate/fructose-6-phosphate phosphoketolase
MKLQTRRPFRALGNSFPELKDLAPTGSHHVSANPTPMEKVAAIVKDARFFFHRDYGIEVSKPGQQEAENAKPRDGFLAGIMKQNMTDFRVFEFPDETTSNKLNAIYEASRKVLD